MVVRKCNWFQAGVMKNKPNNLGGWSKNQYARERRERALKSTPLSWSLSRVYLRCGRALQALANVSSDPETQRVAKLDANYFFEMNRRLPKKLHRIRKPVKKRLKRMR